ncbi:MAG: hypothetical protein ABJD11_14300 [Gemmatimonadota bacterium]
MRPSRGARRCLALLLAASVLACGNNPAAWRAHLADANAGRLVGIWNLRLQTDSGSDATRPMEFDGRVGLTLNESGLGGPGSGSPPELFGTYDFDFSRLGFVPGASDGVPTLVARLRGDSIDLVLGPGSAFPVECEGLIAHDSISGRWTMHQRSGIDRAGICLLYRS